MHDGIPKCHDDKNVSENARFIRRVRRRYLEIPINLQNAYIISKYGGRRFHETAFQQNTPSARKTQSCICEEHCLKKVSEGRIEMSGKGVAYGELILRMLNRKCGAHS